MVTSLVAALLLVLAGSGGVSALGGTTALLPLCVFGVVNVAVLVLRKDPVAHKHFRAPTWAPALAAVLCVYLVLPGLSGKTARDYYLGLGLVVLGLLLWGVNRLVLRGRGEHRAVKEFDPQALEERP